MSTLLAPLLGFDSTTKEVVDKLKSWLTIYRERLASEGWSESNEKDLSKELQRWNPKFVPRSWILEEIIKRVEKGGERKVLQDVMKLVEKPFEESWGEEVEDAERWCAEVPKEKRAAQCSCSS